VVQIDPVKAAAEALRREVEETIAKARNDCDHLRIIEPEERDRRIAEARQRLPIPATGHEAAHA
jgi:hypothetical protein